jgi:ABC-type branched-subunit amino acid transport system permease subunit
MKNININKSHTLIGLGIVVFALLILSAMIISQNTYIILAALVSAIMAWIVILRNDKFRNLVSAIFSNRKLFILGILMLFFLALPFALLQNPYSIHILIMSGIFIILSIGLNIQVGSTGLPNLGYAAFYGVGAYTSSLLAVNFGVSFWIGLVAAALMAGLFGFIVGLPAVKTRNYHLALVTIAFGLVVYILLNNFAFTGGPNGVKDIPPPTIFGYSLLSPIVIGSLKLPYQVNFYFLTLLLVVLSMLVAIALNQSHVGLFWNAVRDDDIAARCSGINDRRAKLFSFVIGAAFGGVGGALYAHYIGYISPENFTMNISLMVLGMVILGGLDNVYGVVLAAFLFSLAPEKFRALQQYRMVASGMIIILMLIFRPSGIIPQTIRKYGQKVLKDRGAS